MGKKTLIVGLTTSLICVILTPTYADSKPDEQFVTGDIVKNWPMPSDQLVLWYEDNIDNLRMPTILYGYNKTAIGAADATGFCNSLQDPVCATASFVKYYSLISACLSDADKDCVESVYAIPDGSPSIVSGKVSQNLPSKVAKNYEGNPALGLPNASNSSIWTLPGIKNGGGTENYALIFSRTGSLQKLGEKWVPVAPGTDGWPGGDFRAALFPVSIIKDIRYKENIATFITASDAVSGPRQTVAVNHPSQLNFEPCAIVADGVCAMREAFPADVQFGVRVRLAKKIVGWMHGRIANPQVDYQVNTDGTKIDIRGYSVKVPLAGGIVTKSSIPIEDQKLMGIEFARTGTFNFTGTSGTYSMNALATFAKYGTDKALASPSQWGFYDLPQNELLNSNSCIKNSAKLAGFVTTNSTAYAAGPPVFNEATQSLDYKVSSLHYLANGEVFKGSYDLYIGSDVARCIYKFSNAPISATISVVNNTGISEVATTVVSERNGWIHLFARGFTFSSPTIRVKLSQAVSVQTKKSILCKKGNSTKKITGSKPRCPKDYKKVA